MKAGTQMTSDRGILTQGTNVLPRHSTPPPKTTAPTPSLSPLIPVKGLDVMGFPTITHSTGQINCTELELQPQSHILQSTWQYVLGSKHFFPPNVRGFKLLSRSPVFSRVERGWVVIPGWLAGRFNTGLPSTLCSLEKTISFSPYYLGLVPTGWARNEVFEVVEVWDVVLYRETWGKCS